MTQRLAINDIDQFQSQSRYLISQPAALTVRKQANKIRIDQSDCSPIDQIEVRSQVVALEVTEELRKILLEENLKGSEILQHLKERDKRRSGRGGRSKKKGAKKDDKE